MSLSEQEVPPEVVAIAVALAALWPTAELALAPDERPGRWRLNGRRWQRSVSHRWS